MKQLNTIFTFKTIIIIAFFSFVSCSKDSNEPSPIETPVTVTTADFSITMDENPLTANQSEPLKEVPIKDRLLFQ